MRNFYKFKKEVFDILFKENETRLKENCDVPAVRAGIQETLDKIKYGEFIILIKEGKIIQIDQTKKQGFPELVGLYGDGI